MHEPRHWDSTHRAQLHTHALLPFNLAMRSFANEPNSSDGIVCNGRKDAWVET